MREFKGRKSKQHRRVLSLMMALMMLLNMFVYLPNNVAMAAVSEVNGAGYRFNNIEVFDVADNGDLTAVKDMTTKIEQDATIKLKFYWEVDNTKELISGSTLTYDIPQIFDWGNVDVSGNLSAPSGRAEDYGTWLIDVSDNKLILTFNGKPNTESNVNGYVEVNVDLKFEDISETLPYTWTVPISETLTQDIVFNVTPKNGQELIKTGARVGTSNDIKWTIDFNTKLENLTAPILSDEYSSLLNFNAASLTIKELTVKGNGDVTLVDADVKITALSEAIAPVDAVLAVTTGYGGAVDFKFNNTDKAYRVEYTTTVDPAKIDMNQTDFSYGNRVKLNTGSFVTATPVGISRGTLITKNGVLSDEFNASSIEWTININNAGYSLTNAKVEDTIPAGLDLTTVILERVSAPGTPVAFADVLPDTSGLMTITLGNITEEYVLKYTTNILRQEADGQKDVVNYTNSAKLVHDLGTAVPTTGATTMAVKQGRVVYKKGTSDIGYDAAKYINWDLYINIAEIGLGTDRTITDAFGADQLLDEAHGITIQEVTVNKGVIAGNDVDSNVSNVTKRLSTNANAVPANVITNVGPGGAVTGFNVVFTDEITKAYKISYRTIIGDYDRTSFTNAGGVGIHNYPGTTNASIGNVYTKNSVGNGINYLTNILDWQIVVNPIEHELDGLVIVDDFPTDQFMTNAQFTAIEITNNNVDFLGSMTSITKKIDDKGNADPADDIVVGFTATFPDDINLAEFKIDYNTTINPKILSSNGNLDYSNTASFKWTGQAGDPLEKTAKPNLNDVAKNNGQKWGELSATNSKEINWIIDVNYLSKEMKDFYVTDGIIGNQNLVPGSVKVYNATLNTGAATNGSGNNIVITDKKTALTKGIEIISGTNNVAISEDLGADIFRIDFTDTHTSPYRIEFTTVMDGIAQNTYNNTATVSNGETYSHGVTYSDFDKFIGKTGTLNGTASIDWAVTVNKSQSTIANMVLTDTLSKGLVLDQSSFVITEADKEFADYFTVSIRDKALVTDPTIVDLTAKQVITEKITLTYTTTIEEDEVIGKSVNNSISLTGDQINFGTTIGTTSKSFASIQGFGTGTGDVGSFTLTKVDKDDNTIKLQGAEYELKRGSKVLGTLTTDVDGKIIITDLLYLDHTLTETKAPDGYRLDPTPHLFTINSATQTATYENEKDRFLKIKKVDASNELALLQGAVFEIYDTGDVLIDTVTTDNTGYAEKALADGDYTIKEITAPSGYYVNSTVETVTIDNSSYEFEVVVKNTRIPYTPSPDPDPEPEPKPEPEVEPVIDLEPVPAVEPEDEPEKKIEEKTTTDTPKEGSVDIPEDSKPKIDEEPENGTVEVDDSGNWTYTPDPGFEGDDSFTIKVENPDGTEEIIYFEFEVEENPLGFVKLPQTGESDSNMRYLLGGLLMLFGIVLFKSKK